MYSSRGASRARGMRSMGSLDSDSGHEPRGAWARVPSREGNAHASLPGHSPGGPCPMQAWALPGWARATRECRETAGARAQLLLRVRMRWIEADQLSMHPSMHPLGFRHPADRGGSARIRLIRQRTRAGGSRPGSCVVMRRAEARQLPTKSTRGRAGPGSCLTYPLYYSAACSCAGPCAGALQQCSCAGALQQLLADQHGSRPGSCVVMRRGPPTVA